MPPSSPSCQINRASRYPDCRLHTESPPHSYRRVYRYSGPTFRRPAIQNYQTICSTHIRCLRLDGCDWIGHLYGRSRRQMATFANFMVWNVRPRREHFDMHGSQRILQHKILQTSCNCFHSHIFCGISGLLQRHEMFCTLGAISHVSQVQRPGFRRLLKICLGVGLSQVTPKAVAYVSWRQVQHHI